MHWDDPRFHIDHADPDPDLPACHRHFGADPVWFGVLTVLCAEIGLLSPPMGVSVFVVKDAIRDPETSPKDVFQGSYPFTAMMTVLLLVSFPVITRL